MGQGRLSTLVERCNTSSKLRNELAEVISANSDIYQISDELAAVLSRHGLTITAETLRSWIDSGTLKLTDDQLDEDQLDAVSGGAGSAANRGNAGKPASVAINAHGQTTIESWLHEV